MQESLVGIFASISLIALGASTPVGRVPPPNEGPTIEFALEERVTIDPGQVLPGGWDFQLTYAASNCTQFSADYFLKAEDGTLIHVFNEGLVCPGAARAIFRPKLEAPKGAYGWMTNATFVATLELEGAPPKVEAVRLRFYQVK